MTTFKNLVLCAGLLSASFVGAYDQPQSETAKEMTEIVRQIFDYHKTVYGIVNLLIESPEDEQLMISLKALITKIHFLDKDLKALQAAGSSEEQVELVKIMEQYQSRLKRYDGCVIL